jgi:hypothetical protein
MSELSAFPSHHEAWRRNFGPPRIVFDLPTLTRKGVTMANYQLQNDEILTCRVNAINADGLVQPIPAGDTFTISVSDPTKLNAVLGADAAGNVTISVNALVRAATGITVTLTDSSGLAAAAQVFDIVGDVKPIGLTFDLADATNVPQDVPPA